MTQPNAAFEDLLVHLRESRGFDFTGYKRCSLMRRVQRRMSEVGVADYPEYQDYLELHAEEFTALFNTILINVTSFFRDPEVWDFLARDVLPALLAAKGPTGPIRVWSAGCASGEEAYTLAIVLDRLLGPEEFRGRVKIYATDVDEESLVQARQAAYAERGLRRLPAELLTRYFEHTGGRHVFRKDLRRSVIFGRNDLVQDAPISKIDLLVCRNTLMYFTADTQSRILSRFDFALAERGVLLLGKAEMLLSHKSLFEPVDLTRRVFRALPRPSPDTAPTARGHPAATRIPPQALDQLRDEALLATPLPQIVVTADGIVAMVSRQAEVLFGLSTKDVGRPFHELEASYRPAELRRAIDQVHLERRSLRIAGVDHLRDGSTSCLEVQLSPLIGDGSTLLGVGIVFHDVTQARRLQDELEQANRRLEVAYEELQSTNEELETTNEELQSTNEELETTNEELQSTNEELETTNEELRSTNDELHTINDELQNRGDDLDQANGFLDAILAGLRSGVVVLSRDLQVQAWNRQAEELWGLRREEVLGQHFLSLDIGLPTELLVPMIRRTLAGKGGRSEVEVTAVNRRGRSIALRVLAGPLGNHQPAPVGAILMMEQENGAGETQR